MHKLTDDQLRVLMYAAAHWEDELRQYIIPGAESDEAEDAFTMEADEIERVLKELGD